MTTERTAQKIEAHTLNGSLVIKDPRRSNEADRNTQWLVLPLNDNSRLKRGSTLQIALSAAESVPGAESTATHLADAADKLANLQRYTDELMVLGRAQGMTWEAIGSALGMTKQAAQQRFNKR